MVDLSLNPTKPYTLWTALTGGLLVSMAAFGVDQDLAQRFLIAKSPARGAMSVIASQFIGIAMVAMFLAIGLLLYVFYKRAGRDGGCGAGVPATLDGAGHGRVPVVFDEGVAAGGERAGDGGTLRGRAGKSGLGDQRDWRAASWRTFTCRCGGDGQAGRPRQADGAPKVAVAAMGAVMVGFAIACVYAYDPKQKGFLDFALLVLNYAFSGMLAVFLTALLTERGTRRPSWRRW